MVQIKSSRAKVLLSLLLDARADKDAPSQKPLL